MTYSFLVISSCRGLNIHQYNLKEQDTGGIIRQCEEITIKIEGKTRKRTLITHNQPTMGY